MTDLLARLAQRPLAPDPNFNGPYFDYLQRKCLEFDRDLALDALSALLAAACASEYTVDDEALEQASTILATLRGAAPRQEASQEKAP